MSRGPAGVSRRRLSCAADGGSPRAWKADPRYAERSRRSAVLVREELRPLSSGLPAFKARSEFTVEQWIDILLRSTGAMPATSSNISRALPTASLNVEVLKGHDATICA